MQEGERMNELRIGQKVKLSKAFRENYNMPDYVFKYVGYFSGTYDVERDGENSCCLYERSDIIPYRSKGKFKQPPIWQRMRDRL